MKLKLCIRRIQIKLVSCIVQPKKLPHVIYLKLANSPQDHVLCRILHLSWESNITCSHLILKLYLSYISSILQTLKTHLIVFLSLNPVVWTEIRWDPSRMSTWQPYNPPICSICKYIYSKSSGYNYPISYLTFSYTRCTTRPLFSTTKNGRP